MSKRIKNNKYPNLILKSGIIKEQVYFTLKEAILDGRFVKGEKIPSSRALAEMMSISRNSVLSGLNQLVDEGYLISKEGSGTYVSRVIPEMLIVSQKTTIERSEHCRTILNTNPHTQNLISLWDKSNPLANKGKVFSVGVGCIDLFPYTIWKKLINKAWRLLKNNIGIRSDPKGSPLLRQNICDYVCSVRGIHCSTEQIIIVNGTQQALNMVSQVILQNNDGVWLDEPGYDGAQAAFTAAGAKIYPIPSDKYGMDIDFGKKNYPNTKLIFTAPSHQFPIGGTLSLARRLSLLEWCEKNNIWVMEDDYNSEFRYSSRPIQALQGLDTGQRVIYAGTFSKMIFPELRIGFLIVPPSLVELFTLTKYYTDSCNFSLEQIVLALFIEEGHYTKHVRRVRRICFERKQALIAAIKKYLPNQFAVQPSDSGIHIVCWLLNDLKENEVIEKSKIVGLGLQPLSRYCREKTNNQGVLLGFAAYTEEQIVDGIKKLAAVL